MTDIVAALPRPGGRRRPRRRPAVARQAARPVGGAGVPPAVVRDRAFYEAWLKALKTLDFDKLSRNAQVDYLYIRKMAELQIARDGVKLPENPPRKDGHERHPGPGARPRRA